MNVRSVLLVMVLAACSNEPKWKTVDVYARDGWKISVTRGYVPYGPNAEVLKTKAPAVGAIVDRAMRGDGEAIFVLTTNDFGCTLAFSRMKQPQMCDRVKRRHKQRALDVKEVSLPNGTWTVMSDGTTTSWDQCRNDEAWAVLISTQPSCAAEAKAREAELIQFIGAAELTPQ